MSPPAPPGATLLLSMGGMKSSGGPGGMASVRSPPLRRMRHLAAGLQPPKAPISCCNNAAAAEELSKVEIYELRKKHFSRALSISYENTEPLLMVRGEKQYLYDDEGQRYLDTRNNVAHIGHAHPRVAEAVSTQVSQLNTNTRYLHPNISKLASRLTSKMPGALSVCFFVNSGSEANDLAIRLARTHTGNEDFIVVDRAYHGHTCAVMDISPYKYEHEGGEGRKPWIHKVPCPDTFRGVIGQDEPEAGPLYAAAVADECNALKAAGKGVAAFFVESGMSVAGVIVPPPRYLETAYAAVRTAGGICVADEVQVGFGRFGDHFWVRVHKLYSNSLSLLPLCVVPEL